MTECGTEWMEGRGPGPNGQLQLPTLTERRHTGRHRTARAAAMGGNERCVLQYFSVTVVWLNVRVENLTISQDFEPQ